MLIAVGKTQEIYCGGNYHHINHTAERVSGQATAGGFNTSYLTIPAPQK